MISTELTVEEAFNLIRQGTEMVTIKGAPTWVRALKFEALSTRTVLSCKISCEALGAENNPKAPDENLITQVALYLL